DCNTADHYSSGGGPGNHAYKISSLFSVSGGERNAAVHTVSGKSASAGSFRTSGCLLPEKCQYPERKPRDPGADRHSGGCAPSSLETADAPLHSGRYGALYGSGADCILNGTAFFGRNQIF